VLKKQLLQCTIEATVTVDPMQMNEVHKLLEQFKEYGEVKIKRLKVIRVDV